ncbi:efflux RND transporter permease subunit [Tistrella mobilis]|uniref:Efflux pump membrane transporter n=1 Tax=Tistrella mobilis TaxID=171437 RepID=A0A162K9W2_9PROT|nr:efflux RND transporter permease subunit [Tistrella mobilis]KYO50773.1 RND transporter [Tistrella mobilis]
MISRFFIDRPVFAAVISIVIVLAGFMAMRALPIEQYPEIVPPQVVVSASYPGASPEVLAESVASPIEQEINGVEGMLYMTSNASAAGTLEITVTFEIGTDPDQATININNRVQAAEPLLPETVRQQGVRVEKRSSSILQVVTMQAPVDRYDPIYVSNYALLNVIDELKRVPGVGDATLFGAKDYSMRIWLKPDELARYDMTPSDVASAIEEQNDNFAAGKFGQEPDAGGQAFTYTVQTPGRLPDAEAFGNIILRSDSNGAVLRLRDVARVELGAKDYAFQSYYNGQPSVAIGIYLQPGANALSTAQAISTRMSELSQRFPEGISYALPYDTTKFVQVSIEEVIKTFAEAIALVIVVVFLFLQSFRATLIPIIAVPVSLIGTFAGMYLLGFSINLLTLFGMVLAIGIVVDDAIVVLENVERVMREKGLHPREAAIQAMQEVSGAVIAIVLVLCAVFVPVGFLGGLTGQMYKQFAITIAMSVFISGIVALTLSPALCALLLKEGEHKPWAFFRWFNRNFDRLTRGYVYGVSVIVKRAFLAILVLAAVGFASWTLFQRIPGSLLPNEDQGYIIAQTYLPPAASLSRTEDSALGLTEKFMHHPAVNEVVTLSGFDLLSSAQKTNAAAYFLPLKDWSQRNDPSLDARNLPGPMMGIGMSDPNSFTLAFNPPPIQGISMTGGFEAYVQDRTGGTVADLQAAVQSLIQAASQRPELTGLSTTFSAAVPQYDVAVDREKAKALGVPIVDVYTTMQATFGSLYVNDFTLFGRTFQVNVQSEGDFRRTPDDMRYVFVRSNSGEMIPLDVLVTAKRIVGPDMLERFNLFTGAKIMGQPAPGFSSGQALSIMEQVAAETLPEGYTLSWTGSAYQEKAAAGSSMLAFGFGIVMVVLILAAQYERWTMPLAVVAAVPFAVLGALLAIWLRGIENDVYFQIGLVTLIGLSAKNAILIVEFAMQQRRAGRSIIDAADEAARLRFRPIVMTSLAFILGVVPLAISSGAGSASRHSIGTGVIGGMLAATFIAMFFVPAFYTLAAKLSRKDRHQASAPTETPESAHVRS